MLSVFPQPELPTEVGLAGSTRLKTERCIGTLQMPVQQDRQRCWKESAISRARLQTGPWANLIPASSRLPKNAPPLNDPSRDRCIGELIAQCLWQNCLSSQGDVDPDTPSEGEIEETEDDQRPKGGKAYLDTLAPELQLRVLDFLDDLRDIGSVIRAHEWPVSGGYLRARFPIEAIHEVEDISADQIDWASLIVGFEELSTRPCESLGTPATDLSQTMCH
ncbi:predicted protein [Uncinocarpus reesii 1704]|uniref:Uncharacterized protein n=1 Tax=Uncinocarpus reesii (strain UAMH 1704) TaxID=336963 RepID=C4JRT9_UNCRE|nr:uncharacterized protein UREG_05178 [Uncinocarpus reesii 1704]EEP80336.1 predicted protein [Uncinocarpus reesii 1704]